MRSCAMASAVALSLATGYALAEPASRVSLPAAVLALLDHHDLSEVAFTEAALQTKFLSKAVTRDLPDGNNYDAYLLSSTKPVLGIPSAIALYTVPIRSRRRLPIAYDAITLNISGYLQGGCITEAQISSMLGRPPGPRSYNVDGVGWTEAWRDDRPGHFSIGIMLQSGVTGCATYVALGQNVRD